MYANISCSRFNYAGASVHRLKSCLAANVKQIRVNMYSTATKRNVGTHRIMYTYLCLCMCTCMCNEVPASCRRKEKVYSFVAITLKK